MTSASVRRSCGQLPDSLSEAQAPGSHVQLDPVATKGARCAIPQLLRWIQPKGWVVVFVKRATHGFSAPDFSGQ